ncbi:Peroxidase 1 [Hordeum vulgare]|nr:Peroxidase 1 [Hordeum vulgare]KAI4984980.1 hypothetical protein ZWY2020_017610 [Hordeum vulgare]
MPGAEGIVFRKTTRIARPLPDQATSLLRLHYHDCFVQACDVSMLLDSTDGSPAEKDAMPNQSPRGMDVVAQSRTSSRKYARPLSPAPISSRSCHEMPSFWCYITTTLLLVLSRTVLPTCLSVSKSMNLIGRPQSKGMCWLVALGRRDGRTSRAGNCGRLPLLYGNITVMIKVFAAKGLDVKDLVMLSAAHTFGKEHCSSFADLLELYNGSICSTDTTLDERYTDRLRMRCRGPRNISTTAELDAYREVARRHGLLMSDTGLMDHPFRF